MEEKKAIKVSVVTLLLVAIAIILGILYFYIKGTSNIKKVEAKQNTQKNSAYSVGMIGEMYR